MKSLYVAALLFAAMLAACGQEQGQQAGADMPVKVAPPKFQVLTEWDEYAGRFQARERVEVRARVSGYLDKVNFTDGQKVQAGDILFVIDQRPFQIAVERATSRFDRASKDYDRARSLRSTNAISQEELDGTFQEFREAKADLDEAKLNLEFTEVKSPISGRVGRNLVDLGNLISGGDVNGTPLTTIVTIDPIDFYFEASEQEILKYIRLDQAGQRETSRTANRPVYLRLKDEKEFIHQGTIDFVDNEVDRSTGTLRARAVFDNADDKFLPGIFGRLRMAGSGEYEAMLVPESVIGTNQTQKFVYVVNAENVLEPRPVVTGPLHDGGMRIIREGLTREDRVVMSGLTILRPGMKVTPVPLEEGESPQATPETASAEAAAEIPEESAAAPEAAPEAASAEAPAEAESAPDVETAAPAENEDKE